MNSNDSDEGKPLFFPLSQTAENETLDTILISYTISGAGNRFVKMGFEAKLCLQCNKTPQYCHSQPNPVQSLTVVNR